MVQLQVLEKAIIEAGEMQPADGYSKVVHAEEFFLDWMIDGIEEETGEPVPGENQTQRRYFVRNLIEMPVLY
jgi:hypothetical protein